MLRIVSSFLFFFLSQRKRICYCLCALYDQGKWSKGARVDASKKKTDRRKSRIVRRRSFDKFCQKRLPLKSTRRTLISCKVFFVEWMERWPNRVTNGSTKQKLKQRGNLFGKSTFNEDITMVILDFEEITSICSFPTEAISQLTRFCGSPREKMSLNFV